MIKVGPFGGYFAASQMGYFQPLDRAHHHHQPMAVSFSRRHSAVKPLNAEEKRNESVVASAATIAAPGMV